jgi:uncharacterized protein (TIGR04255 family)
MTLDLPEPDRSRLPRSPLELVIFQLRFDRHVGVSDGRTATRFQRALSDRVEGFAEISEVVAGEINVAVGAAGQVVNEARTTGWRFGSAKTAAVLMPDHAALETTAYTTWDEFRTGLEAIVDAVHEVVEPALEQRVGLRYVDRITELGLKRPLDWSPYIREELLGAVRHPQLGPHVRAAHQQLLIDLDDLTRCGLRHGPLENPATGTVDYVLDFDVFREGGRPFDPSAVKETAGEFNTWALKLFQASVTDDLLEYLRD